MYAITVNGRVRGEELGTTLPHEHVHCDLRLYCTNGESAATPMASIPMERLRDAPLDFLENLDMRDEIAVKDEILMFKRSGGTTIVELSTQGLAPDHSVLRRVSVATGVHIIAGTGYYTAATHPTELSEMPVAAIANAMVHSITDGDLETGIRAGMIGEIGTSDPLQPTEHLVLRASARAQLETNCPINVHFAPGLAEVFNVFDVLRSEGLSTLERVVVSHADDVLDVDLHERILARGAFVEYDTFGNEGYPSPWGRAMPTDEERVSALAELISAGFVDQLLVSQDVCMKSLWCRYGGHGYINLLDRVPAFFEAAGVHSAERTKMTVTNPARLLAFAA